MADFNSISLLGRLGRDFESRTTTKGTPVASTAICNSQGFGDRKTDSWFEITIFGKQAETVVEHFKKGDQIIVTGSIEMDTWEDKNTGSPRMKPQIKVNSWSFLGSGKRSEGAASAPAPAPGEPGEKDDDIPF